MFVNCPASVTHCPRRLAAILLSLIGIDPKKKGWVYRLENRQQIGLELRQKYFGTEDACGALWEVVIACQGQVFHTASGLPFSYTVRRKRDGSYSGELLITRKEGSKTLTRSSVELAFQRVCRDTAADGAPPFYKGPKAIGQIFGISYVYSLFWAWGLITVPEPVARKLEGGA